MDTRRSPRSRLGPAGAGLAAALLGLAALSAPGAAQIPDPLDMTIRSPDTGAEARGTRVGGFMAYASAGLRTSFNDNIFASQIARENDIVTRVRPRVRLASRWRRHALNAVAEAEATRHLRTPEEDILDYGAALDGRLDLGRDTALRAGLRSAREHENRTSPNDPDGAERTPVNQLRGTLALDQRFARLGLSFAASHDRLDFDNVDAAGGGRVNNDDRDRQVTQLAAWAGYRVTPDLLPFVQATINRIAFDAARDDAGFDRDSRGFEISAGARLRAAAGTVIAARAGLRRQRLEDPALDDITGLSAEVAAMTRLSPLTTLRTRLTRVLEQSTVTNAAAFFATRTRARLDHWLLRRLRLGLDSTLARNSFTSIGREDTIFGAGADASYWANPHLRVDLAYDFVRRVSTADSDFVRNRVTLGAHVSY